MELISLDRILPISIKNQINEFVKQFTNGDEYEVSYGQLFIHGEPINEEHILDGILDFIVEYFRSSKAVILSKTRKQPYVRYRQIIIYMVRKYTDLSFYNIGRRFNIDHSTAVHSVTAANNYLRTDKIIAKQIVEIDEKLRLILIKKDDHGNDSKYTATL